MGILLTLTGPSGAGKTTLAKHLLKTPGFRMVTSLTTRQSRPDDIRREYRHVTRQHIIELERRNLLLWKAEHGGHLYATERDSVVQTLRTKDVIGIMVLVPEVLERLESFLVENGFGSSRTSVFLIPPPPVVFWSRIEGKRDLEEIRRRQKSEVHWEAWARSSGLKFYFVTNDQSIQNAALRVRQLVR